MKTYVKNLVYQHTGILTLFIYLEKDKIQSQYVSELTIIKRSYKEMDEQYKTVVEALGNFAVSQLFVGYSRSKATIVV